MALKWVQRGHHIFYRNGKASGEGLLFLYFVRKDEPCTKEYPEYKLLSLAVRGPRHTKEFCL
jgi:hypothetical protein